MLVRIRRKTCGKILSATLDSHTSGQKKMVYANVPLPIMGMLLTQLSKMLSEWLFSSESDWIMHYEGSPSLQKFNTHIPKLWEIGINCFPLLISSFKWEPPEGIKVIVYRSFTTWGSRGNAYEALQAAEVPRDSICHHILYDNFTRILHGLRHTGSTWHPPDETKGTHL